MLTCLAMALSVVSLSDIPALATEVTAEAQALSTQTAVTPEFLTNLEDFSVDAMSLSDSLRAAGVTQDLPCIFRGISEDARVHAAELQAAADNGARADAFSGLQALLSDAILLAPMAGTAASEAAANPPPAEVAAAAPATNTP